MPFSPPSCPCPVPPPSLLPFLSSLLPLCDSRLHCSLSLFSYLRSFGVYCFTVSLPYISPISPLPFTPPFIFYVILLPVTIYPRTDAFSSCPYFSLTISFSPSHFYFKISFHGIYISSFPTLYLPCFSLHLLPFIFVISV